jgi:anthranilate 1,2-dioxygenase ferredoxin subunit
MSEWFDVGTPDEFEEGEPRGVSVGNKPLAVFRLGEELFALHDLCTHGHARLSEGYVENGCVECPLHQGLFDIRTGAPRSAPVVEGVRTFPVRIVDGKVQISLEENPA